jgi:RNA polymerase sigma factor (sigma-70 family)
MTTQPPIDLASLDDTQLAALCVQGRPGAWTVLLRRYERLIYTVARRAGLDEHTAADVFQVVCTRLFEHLPRLTQTERLQAWLVTTAKRETLAVLRQQARVGSLPGSAPRGGDEPGEDPWQSVPDPAPLAEDLLDDLQQMHRVQMGLQALDVRCRDLLTLLFNEGDDRIDYQQISASLGMPAGSIGPTRSRCLAKLRKWLES